MIEAALIIYLSIGILAVLGIAIIFTSIGEPIKLVTFLYILFLWPKWVFAFLKMKRDL